MDRAIEAGLVERLDGDLYRLTADWRHQMDTYTERAWAKAREAKLEYDRKRRAPKIDRPCSFIFNLAAHLGVSHETT
jgi:inorganic pyrophosphatase